MNMYKLTSPDILAVPRVHSVLGVGYVSMYDTRLPRESGHRRVTSNGLRLSDGNRQKLHQAELISVMTWGSKSLGSDWSISGGDLNCEVRHHLRKEV